MTRSPVPTPPDRRTFVAHVMGMPVSVLVRGPGARAPAVAAAVERAYAELRRVDAVYSTYRTDSEISRLVRGDLSPAACSAEVRDVLAGCRAARERTDGWFDHEYPGPDGGRRLDPSGLVKGWATQRAASVLDALDGPDSTGPDRLVNAGGDVAVRASHPFAVGIRSPFDAAALVDVVDVTSGGVATSGGYQRGGHVRDPRTGCPAAGLASVTVVGPSLLDADVLATAVFAEGPPGLGRVERTPCHEALLVLPYGEVRVTSGWVGRVHGRAPDRHHA